MRKAARNIRYTVANSKTSWDNWYKAHVVYPFGYGLSYTAFTQEIVNKTDLDGETLSATEKISVQVKVTNKAANAGGVVGKDAVQICVTAPYDTTSAKVEKPYVVLAGFAKTGLIQPGASETVTIEIDPYYLASYDYDGRNSSAYKGYLLEAGATYLSFPITRTT